MDNLVKLKKEYKNLKKQNIQDTFIKTNQIKLVFIMTWFIDFLALRAHTVF